MQAGPAAKPSAAIKAERAAEAGTRICRARRRSACIGHPPPAKHAGNSGMIDRLQVGSEDTTNAMRHANDAGMPTPGR